MVTPAPAARGSIRYPAVAGREAKNSPPLPIPDPQIVQVAGPVELMPSSPNLRTLWNSSPRTQNPITTPVFEWPNGKPVSVHSFNGTDTTLRVRAQVRSFGDPAQAMFHPVLEFDVGAADHEHPCIAPNALYSWAPHLWFELQFPFGAPSLGDITIAAECPGGA